MRSSTGKPELVSGSAKTTSKPTTAACWFANSSSVSGLRRFVTIVKIW